MADTPDLGLKRPDPDDRVDIAVLNANMAILDAAVLETDTVAGDLAGTIAAPSVRKINGVTVSGTPNAGEIIKASAATAAAWDTLSFDEIGAPAADLSMASHKITDVTNPTNAQDAATKTYVDTADALNLPKTGGTMTGNITLAGAPVQGLHPATKTYVDTADALNVPLAGGTMTGALTLSGAPSSSLHAATKAYVDANIGGGGGGATDAKDSCAVATTANITLSGEQTIDGVLTSASRVLVKDQTTGSQNGLYVSAAGAWSRATDADTSGEVTNGMFTFVTGGTVNGNTGWILTTSGTITLGTTALTFSKFNSITLPISIGNGGTGATSAAAGLSALGGVPLAGGTMTGALTLSGAPSNASHAATKTYVDTADALNLPKTGGTMTGNITLAGAPSNTLHPASKGYVDTADALLLPLAGGTLTGALTLNSSAPSSALHAASKGYVDSQLGTSSWTATPAWITAAGGSSTYSDHATYVMTGVPATDGPVVRAYAALGPIIFCPGTYVMDTATLNSITACLHLYPNKPVRALIPGTVVIQMAANTITGLTNVPGFRCVVSNASSSDTNIESEGIIYDANAANQGTGIFDVFNAAFFNAINGLRLKRNHFKNARGTAGGSVTVRTVTVTSTNGSPTLVLTSGTVDSTDIGEAVAGANIGYSGTITITAVSGSNITISSNATATGSFSLRISSGSSFTFEKWNCQIYYCSDMLLEENEYYSDNKSSYGATGCGIQYSMRGTSKSERWYNNKYHGGNNHSSVDLTYIDPRAWLNNSSGMLCEYSRDVRYIGGAIGGRSNHRNTVNGEATNTSHGNASTGLGLQGGDNIVVSGTSITENGTGAGATAHNLQIQASTDSTEGPGLTARFIINGVILDRANKYNINLLNSAGRVTKMTNIRSTGAGVGGTTGNRDMYVQDIGSAMTFKKPTGGFVPSSHTKALPAANATVTNDLGFTCMVSVAGGTSVNLTVDSSATGSATTCLVEPGSTVGLGNYTGSPTWTWTIVG